VRGDEIDYIARIAEAWDGRGKVVFTPPTEHQLLLRAARLPEHLWQKSWAGLTATERMAIAWTVYRVYDTRHACGWIFGDERS